MKVKRAMNRGNNAMSGVSDRNGITVTNMLGKLFGPDLVRRCSRLLVGRCNRLVVLIGHGDWEWATGGLDKWLGWSGLYRLSGPVVLIGPDVAECVLGLPMMSDELDAKRIVGDEELLSKVVDSPA
ncbi:hypothetical protein Tco_0344629 [Tanacetum coccineum]